MIEHRLLVRHAEWPHRDQSQNPLGACVLPRIGGLAKEAGGLPTLTERRKLVLPCARAFLLCSRPRESWSCEGAACGAVAATSTLFGC